jgi:hypothetical protein
MDHIMSWRDDLTDEQRAFMRDVQSNLSHVRVKPAGTKVLKDGEWVKPSGPAVRNHSMFPYKSTSMAVEPEDVPEVQERLRKEGLFVDFDREGRPEITSTKQQDALAKALGMKTGRDGYGHLDEHGRFQTSGRRRNDEVQEGRGRVRRVIQELEEMPDDAPAGAVMDALGEYDICPTEENTG